MKLIVHTALFLFLFLPISLNGQTLSINKDSFQIGETIMLTIDRIDHEKSKTDEESKYIDFSRMENLEYLKDTTLFEKYADIEILEIDSNLVTVTENKILLNKEHAGKTDIKFTIYSIGTFVFNTNLSPKNLTISVVPPQQFLNSNDEDIKDIKTIIEDQSFDWMFYLIIAIGLMILSILCYFVYKKIKQYKNPYDAALSKIETQVSPYEEAIQSLNQLKAEKSFLFSDVKLFQTRLTDILRLYIMKRFRIKAFEMTSGEIISGLSKKGLSDRTLVGLNEMFSISDLVKFAKAKPGEEVFEDAINTAIKFVTDHQ